jgi:NO-binding membrane sensor protein with MHYT domain
MGLAEAVPASVVMGIGISTMHYSGMAAMRLPAATHDPGLVILSVAIAVVVSFVALGRFFSHRSEVNRGFHWRKLWSAALMGAAIPSMHYTAMAAARFTPTGADRSPDTGSPSACSGRWLSPAQPCWFWLSPSSLR